MLIAQIMLFDSLIKRYYYHYFTELPIIRSLQNSNALLDLSALEKDYGLWQFVLPTLANNSTVEHLTCRNLPEKEVTHEFIKLLMDALSKNTQIKTLSLNHNPVENISASAIAHMLESNTTLKAIDLSFTNLDNRGITPIAIALEKNKRLKSIKLNGCEVGSITDHLFQVLSNNESLQELELRHCSLQIYYGLSTLLSENQSLKKLHLSMNPFGKDLDYLTEGLKKNKNLVQLNLMACALDTCESNELHELAETLSHHPSLAHLDLSYNGLDSTKYPIVTLALKGNSSIKHLNLTGNGIGDEGVKSLANAVISNHSLNTLILKSNAITHKGLNYLSEALQQNNTIVHLDLTENNIDSFHKLSEGLQNNISITSIDCDHDKISDNSWVALDELLKRNQRIKGSYLIVLKEAEATNDLQGMLKVLENMKEEFYKKEENKWVPKPLKQIYNSSLESIKYKLKEQLTQNTNQEQILLNVIDIYFKSIPLLNELGPEVLSGIRNYVNTTSLDEHEEELFITLMNSIEEMKEDASINEETIECFKNVLDFLAKQIISLHNSREIQSTPNYPSVRMKKYYNQDDFIGKLRGDAHYKSLSSAWNRFSGLCELICNYIIKEDLMGYSALGTSLESSHLPQNLNEIQLMAGLYQLNSDWVLSSHILDTSSNTEKIKAYLLNKYPYTLFSSSDVSKDGKQLDSTLFTEQLDELEIDCYIKFMVFTKSFGKMEGHSMLIKKNTDNTYSFFDPNKGEQLNLTAQELCAKLNKAMKLYNATHVAFLDGLKYIKSLNQSTSDESSAFTSRAHLNVMRIDPLDRQTNINTVFHLLSNSLFRNTEDSPPRYIKEIISILRQIDYNNELNIVKNIIEIKRISKMEPAPDENSHVLALRAVFNSSTSTTFANIVANLNKEPQIQKVLDELASQKQISHGQN